MSAKEPLVLLPGLLCDAALWQYQITALSEFSDPMVADLMNADTLEEMAKAVLAAAPPRFAIAGLSMGGYVGFELLRQAPNRISRAAFLDTSARADTEEARARRHDLIQLAQIGKFKGVTPRLLPLLLHPRHLTEPLTTIVKDMAERVGQAAFIRQEKAILGRIDSRATLGTVHVPTMVLCGDADELTPPYLAEEIASGIPGAELVIVPDSGHLSALEQPEIVNRALIDWLTDNY
jgi:pimeloyl-ACP methyl ester carboxylesterase